jgi:hypothetical protein
MRPIISANGAYSRLDSPVLLSLYSGGRNRFLKPFAFAFSCMSATHEGTFQRLLGILTNVSYSCSIGSIWLSINVSSLRASGYTLSE